MRARLRNEISRTRIHQDAVRPPSLGCHGVTRMPLQDADRIVHPPRERPGLVRTSVVLACVAVFVAILAALPGEIRWHLIWERRALFAQGLGLTVVISTGALAIGLVLGTAAALARVSRSVALHQLATTYVEIVRGTPFLVQLYIWYFGVATVLRLNTVFGTREAAVIGAVGLGVFAGSYVAEIVRAAVESVERGQWEAARSLGLSHAQTIRHVILPQCVQRMLPPLTGEAVSLVKESSLLSIIAVAELTYHAKNLQAHTYETWASFLTLAALYLCITLPLSFLTRRMERRLAGPQPLPVSRL